MRAFASLLVLLTCFSPIAKAAENGKPAPAFEVQDINGKPQSLKQYEGSIVVLEWTNPGCPFVHKHYDSGNMQALQKYATGKNIVWLSINSSAKGKEGFLDEVAARQSIKDAKASPTAYILDPLGKLGHLYTAKTTPHMFIIDTHGVLVYQGAIDSIPSTDAEDIKKADNYVKAALDALLAGKPITTAQSRAYGCSVKYE